MKRQEQVKTAAATERMTPQPQAQERQTRAGAAAGAAAQGVAVETEEAVETVARVLSSSRFLTPIPQPSPVA
jgi:hypothetical protein